MLKLCICIRTGIFRRFCSITSMRILNVAEKNDAAKNIADVLSRGRFNRREGYSKFNKIYEFPFEFRGQSASMLMTSVSGHLMELAFPHEYKYWTSVDPLVLFDAPVAKRCPDNFNNIKQTLEREARNSQKLIIWTDCDREGENIGFEIIDVCLAVNPNLEVLRARFSEITNQAIFRAINNLDRPNALQSAAVDVRQELDLRIGAAFTRFQTLRLTRLFEESLSGQTISYGSCQFPTLGFVVERFNEVENFQKEPFWKIKVVHVKDEKTAEFSWKRGRLFDRLCCYVLYEHCLEAKFARVIKVINRPKNKWRPYALDTVELEKLASRKLRMPAKETMRVAEKLYNDGYISYPRTETNIFPPGLNLRNLVQIQSEDHRWSAFAFRILDRGPNPKNGRKSDHAHPPIHPLKVGSSLQGNAARLFEFIARHFLACVSSDAVGRESVVEIDLNSEFFELTGLAIIERNYLEVYPYDRWTDKEIPNYELNEEFVPTSVDMIDGETSPPNLLTEADLIALMDKYGIGTDATHAEHIEKIKSRLYIGTVNDKFLVPGELGMGLVTGYDDMGFQMSKPHLRAELEQGLKQICVGQRNKDDVLREQIDKYREVFRRSVTEAQKLDNALGKYFERSNHPPAAPNFQQGDQSFEKIRKCPDCSSDAIVKRRSGDQVKWMVSCRGYPMCKYAVWFPDSVTSVRVLHDQPCPNHPADQQIHKVGLKLSRGTTLPFADIDMNSGDVVTCIFCDKNTQEALGIRLHKSGNSTQTQQTTGTSQRSASYPPPVHNPSNPPRPPAANIATVSSRPRPLNSNSSATHTRLQNDADQENAPVCLCGVPSVELTVRKEGPNQGRKFYRCGNQSAGMNCDFFQWRDSAANSDHPNRGNSRTNVMQPSNSNTMVDASNVVCNCGLPVKSLTVQKESVNKGRPFFACSKSREESCNFFQWADEPPAHAGFHKRPPYGGSNPAGSSSNFNSNFNDTPNWPPPASARGISSKRGKVGGTNAKRGPRKCSRCGEPGHTKNNCKS